MFWTKSCCSSRRKQPGKEMDDFSTSDEAETDLKYTHRAYGPHKLQRYGVWEIDPTRTSGYWVIFIHGGAWVDPNNTHLDFVPSIKSIFKNSEIDQGTIRGYASLDYRLSGSEDSTLPAEERRSAKHPDHIIDVRTALHHFKESYGLEEDEYILIGHSAGAFLCLQTLMGSAATEGRPIQELPKPRAVAGISGIYDLVGLWEANNGYESFLHRAFGNSHDLWTRASPARYQGSFRDVLNPGHLIYLAWGPDDGLVTSGEIEAMARKCGEDNVNFKALDNLKGTHDFVWRDGTQVAEMLASILKMVKSA